LQELQDALKEREAAVRCSLILSRQLLFPKQSQTDNTATQHEIRSMQQKHFFLNLRPLRSLLTLLPPLPLQPPLTLITMHCS
jgi:hypothetical protein